MTRDELVYRLGFFRQEFEKVEERIMQAIKWEFIGRNKCDSMDQSATGIALMFVASVARGIGELKVPMETIVELASYLASFAKNGELRIAKKLWEGV